MENLTVEKILEKAREKHQKIRIWYGDRETGRDWGDVFDTFGFVGKSVGKEPIFLLIRRETSIGGPAILTDCIVRITIDKKEVYRHPNFHQPEYSYKAVRKNSKLYKEGYRYSVFAGDTLIRNCQKEKQAQNEIDFHKGLRNVA